MRCGWWDPSESNQNLAHSKFESNQQPHSTWCFLNLSVVEKTVEIFPQDWCHTDLSRNLLARFPSINIGLHWVPHTITSSVLTPQLRSITYHYSSSVFLIGECAQWPQRLLSYQLISVYKMRFPSRELMAVTNDLQSCNDMSSSTLPSGGELDILCPEEQS